MTHTVQVPVRPVSTGGQEGPGFVVAMTEPQHGRVHVHLIGRLEAATAPFLTAASVALRERPEVHDVVLDLSSLTFVDHVGMTVLRATQALLHASGRAVTSAHPHGPDLRLLDCAARAGWAPPHLACTDILHWKPRPAAEARSSR